MTRLARPTALALALTAVLAAPAQGFLQTTKSRGVLGADIGGIWLALHHMAPTFRVRVEREDEKTPMPFEVAPLSPDLAPLAGDPPLGVAIKSFRDSGASGRYGILAGDLVIKVNAAVVRNMADWEKALTSVGNYALVTIRRPRLVQTRARLLKISYAATEAESEGTSQIASERITMRVLDVVLPFEKELSEASTRRLLWRPKPEQLKRLAAVWHRLEDRKRPMFVGGEHEMVGRSDYSATERKDETLEGTLFSIVSKMRSNPLGGGGTNISIYGVRTAAPDSITGNFVESTLANAPFPISVDFGGTFSMTRIDGFSDRDLKYRKSLTAEKVEKEYGSIEVAPDIPATR